MRILEAGQAAFFDQPPDDGIGKVGVKKDRGSFPFHGDGGEIGAISAPVLGQVHCPSGKEEFLEAPGVREMDPDPSASEQADDDESVESLDETSFPGNPGQSLVWSASLYILSCLSLSLSVANRVDGIFGRLPLPFSARKHFQLLPCF